MSKAPTRPLMAAPTPPTAYQLEQGVSLFQQFYTAAFEDGLDLDESEIGMLIREAGAKPPREMLERLIDVAIVMDQRVEHLDMLRRRYIERRDAYAVRYERARETIRGLLDVLGVTAAEGELGAVSFAKPRATVEADVSKLPEEYIRRTEPEPRKLEIARALKAGETVPGAAWKDLTNEPPILRLTAY